MTTPLTYANALNAFDVNLNVTGAGQFTTPASFDPRKAAALSVSGSFSATVTFQRSFDGGNTWYVIYTTTAPVEENFTPSSRLLVPDRRCGAERSQVGRRLCGCFNEGTRRSGTASTAHPA